jgi:L-asparaginase/Glu-tRNA(Gln) amidotransferase subunit D
MARALILRVPTELLAIFALVTALFLICAVPTLFAGRLAWAYAPLASATNNATSATAIAGDGLMRLSMVFPSV